MDCLNDYFAISGPPQHITSSNIVTSVGSNQPSPSHIQRVVVRQPEAAEVTVNLPQTQIRQQSQSIIVQSSQAQPASQTKMISAAELQKLISSGAVKTVTRTSILPQTSTNTGTPSSVSQTIVQDRQNVTIQRPQPNQPVSKDCKATF